MGSRRTSGGSKHLSFEYVAPQQGRKMAQYNIYNDEFGEYIGIIHWRGGWRQYVYRMHPGVDVSRSCGKEIHEFIDKIMKEWREGLKKCKDQ